MSDQDHLEPGATLREAREAAGLSTQDVADSLNLLVSNIEAIEANDFRLMNADIFVRGYVKSYARHLNLDSERLLRATDALLKSEKQSASTREVVVASPIKPVQKVIAALVLAAIAWAGANFWLGHTDDHSDEAQQQEV